MGIDVVSSGEIYTALQAGYDLGQAYFHSNNKTDEDIRYSMEHGIGYFVPTTWRRSGPSRRGRPAGHPAEGAAAPDPRH